MGDWTTVTILDRNYKLQVKDEEVTFLQQAAKLIDQQARSYGKIYHFKDNQDLLSMVSLTQITQMLRLQDTVNSTEQELIQELSNIENTLNQALTNSDKKE